MRAISVQLARQPLTLQHARPGVTSSSAVSQLVTEDNGEFLQFFSGKVFHSGF